MTSSHAGQNGQATAPPTTPPPNASNGDQPGAFTAATLPPEASASAHNQVEAVSATQPGPSGGIVTDRNESYMRAAIKHEPQTNNVKAEPESYAALFPHTPLAGIDPHGTYMMMALAQISASQMSGQMSPPPTVTPAQVTLPSSTGADGMPTHNHHLVGAGNQGLESFARIEFADSVFQMTTYGVIIGRDQRAMDQARRDEKRAEEYKRRVAENEREGLPPPSPIRHDRGKFSKSYVSEEGGMLGPESDGDENGRPAKRRKTTSTGSSQQEATESQENLISNRQYVSHTPGAAAVDLTSLRPSPYHVPFIGIHSPGPDIASKTKAISREHLRIQFNQKEGVFEAHPLHKNGFFIDEVHYKDEKVILRSGDRLQIKDIDFCFIINGVEEGRTGAEEYADEEETSSKRYSEGGKEMSFEFEASHGNGELQDTSSESSGITPLEPSDDGEEEEAEENEEAEGDSDLEEEEEDDDDDGEVKDELEEPDPEPLPPPIPKKRGPGRPPKNGIMSKREQRLLKKQQQEMAKKTLPQAPPGEPPVKRKVGRPRKHPLPEDSEERPEKRKYKPRKPKNEDGGEGSDAERRAKEKKEKKVRPKSPPLELKIEDYTEEQLQKPNKNYGVLIDETLTAAGPDGLTLKQIYKRITQRYPWFYFHTETKGWESSVRHNLIGNEAFKKDDTTGLWARVPGVELDAGKKRKAPSPERTLGAQGYGPYSHPMYPPYAGAPHMVPGAQGYQHVPPGYHAQAFAAQPGQIARPAQPYASGAAAAGQTAQPVAAQPVAPAQLPGYGVAAIARPQVGGTQTSTYSSPYASRPPPSNPPIKTEDGAAPHAAQTSAAAATSGGLTQPVPAAMQQAAAAAARPTQTPPAAVPPRHVIEPRLFNAVVGLKNGLIENLKKARNPKAEAIVMSALNRCMGLKNSATENEAMENICMKGIQQVLNGYLVQHKSPTPGGSSTPKPNEPGAVFEPKVLNALVGFKNVSAGALKVKIGEAKAEAVTLSAIDRVLGLADASIVAPSSEAGAAVASTGNFEGIEGHLMNSVKQLLLGLNQKLHGS